MSEILGLGRLNGFLSAAKRLRVCESMSYRTEPVGLVRRHSAAVAAAVLSCQLIVGGMIVGTPAAFGDGTFQDTACTDGFALFAIRHTGDGFVPNDGVVA